MEHVYSALIPNFLDDSNQLSNNGLYEWFVVVFI